MEFWIRQDNYSLRLPIPPANYKLKWANNNSSFLVEGMGEVSFLGKPKLVEIDPIQSFFPLRETTLCQYTGFPSPKECTALIQMFKDSGKLIRYIITDTPVNILCSIESFEIEEKDGTGDIYFTLQLKEYKVIP